MKCYFCKDSGFVPFYIKEGYNYEYLSTCGCDKGKSIQRTCGSIFLPAEKVFTTDELEAIKKYNVKIVTGKTEKEIIVKAS